MTRPNYDIAVVGGGAAGSSAALVLARARRTVAIVDAGEPRNAPAAHVHGFLSRDGMPPGNLRAAVRAELRRYGVDIVDGRVVAVTDGFTLELGSGERIAARQLLLATGATDELPDIPGARERWGRDVLHCPYCHGWEVRDQPLGVLATHPAAVAHAHLVRQWSHDIVLFSHGQEIDRADRARLEARGIVIVDGRVARLSVADDRLAAVHLTDGRSVPRAAVFVRPDPRPIHARLGTALGCDLDDAGFIQTDREGRTSVPGVWAAGNATNPRAQVITAAGEGSTAAIAINTELVDHDIRDASTRRPHDAKGTP